MYLVHLFDISDCKNFFFSETAGLAPTFIGKMKDYGSDLTLRTNSLVLYRFVEYLRLSSYTKSF